MFQEDKRQIVKWISRVLCLSRNEILQNLSLLYMSNSTINKTKIVTFERPEAA